MPQPIYLDNNATTPLDPRVIDAMLVVLREHFGNPASKTHSYGWAAEELVQIARENVAKAIGAEPDEIIFTSGATESNNLALSSAAGKSVLSVATEHKSVLDVLGHLRSGNAKVKLLSVDKDGLLDADELKRSLSKDTALVSIMLANNEIGVVQDIAALAKITKKDSSAWFHSDATQALGKLPVNVKTLGVDLLSISAHKIYGPKGVGALYVKRDIQSHLQPLLFGGGHERGLRSGTLNMPGIVGFGKACELIASELDSVAERLKLLADRMLSSLRQELVDLTVNGSLDKRIVGNLNLSFKGIGNDALIGAISSKVAISSTSACTSGAAEPSYVLKALGLSEDVLLSSVRIGIGRFNSEADIDSASKFIVDAVKKLKR